VNENGIPNVLAAVLLICACAVFRPASAAVIADVTVISPERAGPLEHAYVRIENGRIEEISARPLQGEPRIDGRGKFLIPGLIDSHIHLGQVPGMVEQHLRAHRDLVAKAEAQEPRSYLYFGFTTVLSLGDTAGPIKRWNALAVRPDAYFCGATPMVNGYSFRGFGDSPYFLFNPDQAASLPASVDKAQHAPEVVVERMAKDGAICVKSYRETGFGRNAGKLPAPGVEMIRKVVAAAHARNMPVFLHANSKPAQAFAVEAGVDVIAHGMWNGHESSAAKLDADVEPIVKSILAKGMGYQPTTQVIRGLGGILDDQFFADPLLARVYAPELIAWYRSPEGRWFRDAELGGVRPVVFQQIESYGSAVVTHLARNNGRLLFGTDTPSAPVYTNPPGLNGFYEMHRWIGAGVSTKQLFRAITIENARIMRLDREIGSIEKGKRAHLLLLRANPLDNVEAYNTIETVFLAGKPIPRETLTVSALR
jgi:imidazolonepropionase-like amidohydrolase